MRSERRRPRAWIAAAVMLVPGAVLAADAASPRPANSVDRLREGLVHVGEGIAAGSTDVERWLGTGFVVDAQCTIATAKHLFDIADRARLVVRWQHPGDRAKVRTATAALIWEDPGRDLAFLRIRASGERLCDGEELRPLALLPAFDARLLAGEDVRIAGFPRLGPYDVDVPVARAGIVASADVTEATGKPLLLLDLAGVPGFSGSPVVLDRTGQVIGVVFGPGPIDRSASFEFATPLDAQVLAAAIDAMGKPAAPRPSATPSPSGRGSPPSRR